MANWTENDLKRQFERAKKNGWIKTFKSAAATYQFPPEVLMAIASRETNMRNIIGDGGHGYGLVQIDDRSFPEWCNSGLWKDPLAGIHKGALVLHSKQQPFEVGRVSRFGWVASRSLANQTSARTIFCERLLQHITPAYGPTTTCRSMAIPIVELPGGIIPKTRSGARQTFRIT